MQHLRSDDTEDGDEEDSFTNADATRTFSPLELEDDDERESLVRETAGLTRAGVLLKRRNHAATQPSDDSGGRISYMRGFIRSTLGSTFSWKHMLILGALAGCFVLFLSGEEADLAGEDYSQGHPKGNPHESSFAKPSNKVPMSDEDFPISNVGHAIPSLSVENVANEWGHYFHNPFFSPYHNNPKYPEYTTNITFLLDLQNQFDQRRQKARDDFGEWNEPDFSDLISPHHHYDKFDYRDVPGKTWPPKSWQKNEQFQRKLIQERKALAERVRRGIYMEYGYNNTQDQEAREIFGIVIDYFRVTTSGAAVDEYGTTLKGVAFMGPQAFDGLVHKLLHAMMVQDDFYVVAVGPSTTYKGVNFAQSSVMQFNYIMEPLMDLMGIKLVSRNMGMDVSTTVNALGGSDIYGEADILWYIPPEGRHSPKENVGQMDLLHKQAILSGERMPVILTPNPVKLIDDTNRKVWLGNLQPDCMFCHETSYNRSSRRPILPRVPACAFVRCSEDLLDAGGCRTSNSVCWMNRTDVYEPPSQRKSFPDQTHYFPNYRVHQCEGRKLALLVLEAIDNALDKWLKELDKTGAPISDDAWHVGAHYTTLRDEIRITEPEANSTACDWFLQKGNWSMSRICHLQMHALTEWTPRVRPNYNNITSFLTTTYDIPSQEDELYGGVDLWPPSWNPKVDEVDVHMIALAMPNLTTEEWEAEEDFLFGYDKLDETNDSASDETMDDDLPVDENGDPINGGEGGDGSDVDARDGESPRLLKRYDDYNSKTWTLHGQPVGFCDGSSQSRCNRQRSNDCIMSNYNFYTAGMIGTAESDWIKFSLPIVEGIILVRIDFTEFRGSASMLDLPEDFRFEYWVDGETNFVRRHKFMVEFGRRITDDLTVYPLLMDPSINGTVEAGFRFHTKKGSHFKAILTHIYYA